MTVQTHVMDIDAILQHLPNLTLTERQMIERAYRRASEAHQGQTRMSGEPYLVHCVAVAQMLAELHMDAPTISAALLHDVVEDTPITLDDIEKEFGPEVAKLVDGVSKIERLPTNVEKMRGGKAGSRESEYLRKTFLTMGNDIRVILIKLADRLHNMRTLGYLSPEKQQRMARETMDLFAPLANRLGIWQMKWELEDLSFRYLNPDKYKEIRAKIAERRADREKDMQRVRDALQHELEAAGIQATINARPKHIYSIYRKMERKKVPFEQVYDVRAVRIMVADKATCYQVLGIIHSLWRPIPGEFDDYIAAPKDNFYQSLHTAVLDHDGKTLEVQIRTPEMHEHAEYGVAAHWRYKEGVTRDDLFEKRLMYLRRLMENVSDETAKQDSDAFIDAMKSDVFEDRVYAFTPKGDIVDMPGGATPVDFAYHIHTDIGHRCRGARVNGQLVNLDYRLRSGDRVEILTAKRGGPSLDWLNPNLGFANTNRSRVKIRAWFRKQDREKNIALGHEVLVKELKRLGMEAMSHETIANMFNYARVEDFLANVGYGDITGAQIAQRVLVLDNEQKRENATLANTQESLTTPINMSDGIDVMGNSGMLINLGRCCNPAQGDAIVGYITRGRGITVHRADCPNVINSTEYERFINVSWGRTAEKTYRVPVTVTAYDREGLMRDIGAVVANENINISNLNITTKQGIATFYMTMEIESTTQLMRVLAKIEQLSNVMEARRRTSV
ncbi:MAG TPA: bifunctional (p)ppGpp synthetase/guanosine-3',5'-bis(diphosphate) 3'-pyrophosphohydrolase [Aggregatilineales bacterium]|nr:bifunctional (p)ppGpp synthetase/guanosine-3',5'-bis(diphosphate) 3'-pyrophosphohydrolase [Aggregatilineales bacterium]